MSVDKASWLGFSPVCQLERRKKKYSLWLAYVVCKNTHWWFGLLQRKAKGYSKVMHGSRVYREHCSCRVRTEQFSDLVLVRASQIPCCNHIKHTGLFKNTENIEWSVSVWIFRPEKLIVPQWTRSVNRVCGRISLNHALCLGGLHKQSSQWSCVSHYHRQVLRVCVCVCVCVCLMSSLTVGSEESSQGVSPPLLLPSISRIDNSDPDWLDSKFNSIMSGPKIDFKSWLHHSASFWLTL